MGDDPFQRGAGHASIGNRRANVGSYPSAIRYAQITTTARLSRSETRMRRNYLVTAFSWSTRSGYFCIISHCSGR